MSHPTAPTLPAIAAAALALAALAGPSPAHTAVVQTSIVVGDTSASHRWKCITTADGQVVYVATGTSERRASTILEPYAVRHISCRQRPIMLFGGD